MRNLNVYLLLPLAALTATPLESTGAALLFLCIGFILCYSELSQNVSIPGSLFLVVPYLLGFPIVVLLPNLYWKLWTKIPEYTIDQTMLWSTRGFAMLAVGYSLTLLLQQNKHQTNPNRATPGQLHLDYVHFCFNTVGLLALGAWLGIVLRFGISLVFVERTTVSTGSAVGTFLQILTLLAGLRYSYFLAFLLLYYKKKTTRLQLILFSILLGISLVEIVIIGSKEAIIRLIVISIMTLALLPTRLSLKHLVVLIVLLINIYGAFSIVAEYRSIILDQKQRGYKVFEYSLQVDAFKKAFWASLPYSESYQNRSSHVGGEEVLGRFGSGIMSFANLLRVTAMRSPYKHAKESFLVPLYSFVPRALMPDKPIFFNSAMNAHDYFGWVYGGISVSTLGSLYFAWGYPGILGGMLLFGCLFAYGFNHVRYLGLATPHWIIGLISITLPLMDVGVTFQSVITDCIRVMVLLFCIHLAYHILPTQKRLKTT